MRNVIDVIVMICVLNTAFDFVKRFFWGEVRVPKIELQRLLELEKRTKAKDKGAVIIGKDNV